MRLGEPQHRSVHKRNVVPGSWAPRVKACQPITDDGTGKFQSRQHFRIISIDIGSAIKEPQFHGRGADIGFEVVGIATVLKTVIESVRKGAQITLVGNVSAEVNFPLQQIVTRQLKLQGSCAICGEYEPVLDLINRGLIKIDPLTSAIAPLTDGAKWFNRLYNREKGLMKVILKP